MANGIERINGTIEWTTCSDDKYIVTGVDRDGKRVKKENSNYHYIAGINIYRGSRWLVRNGKRHLLQRVYN